MITSLRQCCLIGITTLIFSCKEQTESKKTFDYQAHINQILDSVSFDELVENYRYIKLETTKESLIGEVQKIIIQDNCIYIFSNGIICFDMDGKHLFSINSKGKGPSEFIKINDFSVDNNRLYIYDNGLAKILCFDSRNGRYVNEFRLSYSVRELQIINDTALYMNRSRIPNKFIKEDNTDCLLYSNIKDQKDIKSYMPLKTFSQLIPYQLWSYNKQIYWLDPLFNELYKFRGEKLIRYLKYDFGSSNLTEKEANEFSATKQKASNKATTIGHPYETSDLIFSSFILGEEPVYTIFNKKQNKVFSYRKVSKTAPYQIEPGAHAVFGDSFCRVISNMEARFFRYFLKDKKNLPIGTDGMAFSNYFILKNYNDNDNPIIAIYKFRESIFH